MAARLSGLHRAYYVGVVAFRGEYEGDGSKQFDRLLVRVDGVQQLTSLRNPTDFEFDISHLHDGQHTVELSARLWNGTFWQWEKTSTPMTVLNSSVPLTGVVQDRTVADTFVSVSDALAVLASALGMVDVGATIIDSVAKSFSMQKAVADLVIAHPVLDTVARGTPRVRAVSDTGLTPSSTLASTCQRFRPLSTQLVFSDSLAKLRVYTRSAVDTGVTFTDTLIKGRVYDRNLDDVAAVITEASDDLRGYARAVTDTGTTISDALATGRDYELAITDTGVTLTESVVKGRVYDRAAADSAVVAGWSDSWGSGWSSVTDSMVSVRTFERATVTTGATITDSTARLANKSRATIDTPVVLTDSTAKVRAYGRAMADTGATVTSSIGTTGAVTPQVSPIIPFALPGTVPFFRDLGALRIATGAAANGGDLSRVGLVVYHAAESARVPALRGTGVRVFCYRDASLIGPPGGLGGLDTSQVQAGWYARSGGATVQSAVFPGYYIADVAVAAYQNAWAAAVIAVLQAGGWSGVYMHDVAHDMVLHRGASVLDGYPNDTSNLSDWTAAMTSFIANVSAQIKAAGFAVIPNINNGDYWREANKQWFVDVATTCGNGARENWMKWGMSTSSSGWGNSWGSVWGSTDAAGVIGQLFNDVDVAAFLDTMIRTQNAGAGFFATTYSDSTDLAGQAYARAGFLIGYDRSRRSALTFEPTDPEAQAPLMYPWTKELGLPLGAYSVQAFGAGNLYSRTYAGGVVTLNTALLQGSYPGYVNVNDNGATMSDTVARFTPGIKQLTDTGATISASVVASITSAFPSTAVLDNFNRATLGANWTTITDRSDLFISVSTVLTGSPSAWSMAYWNPLLHGVNAEAYITILAFDGTPDAIVQLGICMDEPRSWQSRQGYLVSLFPGSTVLYRAAAGVDVVLASWSPAWAVGDSLGIRRRGSQLAVYRKPGAGAWVLLGSVADASYSGGYLTLQAFGRAVQMDNFGGGNMPF